MRTYEETKQEILNFMQKYKDQPIEFDVVLDLFVQYVRSKDVSNAYVQMADRSSDIKKMLEDYSEGKGIRQFQEEFITRTQGPWNITLPRGVEFDDSTSLAAPDGQFKMHVHEYVEYKGLVEQYEYCKSCNERKM